MFYTEFFFLGNKPLGYCVYEVFDVNNAKSIDGIKATIRVEKNGKRTLQVKNVKKGKPYILKINGNEMTKLWEIENCKFNEHTGLSYPPISMRSGSFEFNITGILCVLMADLNKGLDILPVILYSNI